MIEILVRDEDKLVLSNSSVKELAFTQEDIDENLTACTILYSNEIGKMSSADARYGRSLLGKVLTVSTGDLNEEGIPKKCMVQMRGMARFKYDLSKAGQPVVGHPVTVASNGMVRSARVTIIDHVPVTISNFFNRGIVMALHEDTKEVDVWLG